MPYTQGKPFSGGECVGCLWGLISPCSGLVGVNDETANLVSQRPIGPLYM